MSTPDVTEPDGVGWTQCLEEVRGVAERLAQALDLGDQNREADIALKMFGAISGACLTFLWADPDHPTFFPSVGYYQMYGSPNPDTVYRTAAVDGNGQYQITGQRGTAPDVSIMAFGGPTAEGLRTYPPFELSELAVAQDGTFEVVVSRERPAGVQNWWQLDEGMRTLMLRSVSEEWGTHVDPRLAIVRLDVDPRRARVTPQALRERLQFFPLVVEGMIMSGIKRVRELRTQGVINRLAVVDYSGNGGRSDQWYQEGCFSLADGEVLVIEAHPSPGCRAFSLSLTDPFFSTIDWTNAHSSMNHHQALLQDGTMWAVVADADPGIHNWLDTTGHRLGVLQCRWLGGTAMPEVSLTPVPVTELDALVPSDVARVSPEGRVELVRERQRGAQLRSYW
jgi:hypothetical protein